MEMRRMWLVDDDEELRLKKKMMMEYAAYDYWQRVHHCQLSEQQRQ
jgi:hypothetical protein